MARLHDAGKTLSIRGANFTLPQIGVLATCAKTVISVCTGPLHVAFNTTSIKDQSRKWHIFHNTNSYTYSANITMHRNGMELNSIM